MALRSPAQHSKAPSSAESLAAALSQGPEHSELSRDFTFIDDIVEGIVAALGAVPPSAPGKAHYKVRPPTGKERFKGSIPDVIIASGCCLDHLCKNLIYFNCQLGRCVERLTGDGDFHRAHGMARKSDSGCAFYFDTWMDRCYSLPYTGVRGRLCVHCVHDSE